VRRDGVVDEVLQWCDIAHGSTDAHSTTGTWWGVRVSPLRASGRDVLCWRWAYRRRAVGNAGPVSGSSATCKCTLKACKVAQRLRCRQWCYQLRRRRGWFCFFLLPYRIHLHSSRLSSLVILSFHHLSTHSSDCVVHLRLHRAIVRPSKYDVITVFPASFLQY
jgi:hypothetical protein